jgi:hypothetical protein
MLAISSPVVGAAAPCFGDPAIVQPDGNLVGCKLAALHFRRQSIDTPNEIRNGPVAKVAVAARERFRRGERPDGLFPYRSLDHVWTFKIAIASMRAG